MPSRRKPAHVNAHLRDNHVRGRRADARNCHQAFDRSVKGCEQSLDLRLESRDRLFQVRNRFKMLA